MMFPKVSRKLAILSTIICSIITNTTSVLSEDECSLSTRSGIDVSQVKVAKNYPSRDKTIEQYIRTEHSGILYSRGSVLYSYNKVDLDGDGQPEILLKISSSPSPYVCDIGGCPIEILKYNGSRYSLIDSFLSFSTFIVTSDRTNGFKDIVILYIAGEDILLKYSSFEKVYIQTKQYPKNSKIKGTAYLVCGKYFNLVK
jgi:hypothetical protein